MTDKQSRFCEEYVVDMNATQAAIRAGYSEHTAYSIANRLLRKVEIRDAIKELREDIQVRNQVSIDELVGELAGIVRVDPIDIISNSGKFKDLEKIDEDVRATLKSIQIVELVDGSIKTKVEFYSKLDAIEKLMRYLGAYEKDNEQRRAEVNIIEVPENGRE